MFSEDALSGVGCAGCGWFVQVLVNDIVGTLVGLPPVVVDVVVDRAIDKEAQANFAVRMVRVCNGDDRLGRLTTVELGT
jgi:hypothetical protein